ncbi:MAG: hypothetical protein IPP60_14605 [Sphingobacteriales bacterium]|nr:hypothetical protein [Sphingobacteriales bacterium]
MRSGGRGIDPRANFYDMSDDAIGYAIGNIKMVNDALPKLLKNTARQINHIMNYAMAILLFPAIMHVV